MLEELEREYPQDLYVVRRKVSITDSSESGVEGNKIGKGRRLLVVVQIQRKLLPLTPFRAGQLWPSRAGAWSSPRIKPTRHAALC